MATGNLEDKLKLLKERIKDPNPLYAPFYQGWTRAIIDRTKPTPKKKYDLYYYTPEGTRLRSWNATERFLKTNPYPFTAKNFNFRNSVIGVGEPHEIIRNAMKKKKSKNARKKKEVKNARKKKEEKKTRKKKDVKKARKKKEKGLRNALEADMENIPFAPNDDEDTHLIFTNIKSKDNNDSNESKTSNQFPEKRIKINIPTGNILYSQGLDNMEESIPVGNLFDITGNGDINDDDSILMENNYDGKGFVNEEVSIDEYNEAEYLSREDIKRAKNGNKKLKQFMPSKAIKFSTKSKSKMKRIMKDFNKKKKMQKADMENIPLLPNDEKDKYLIFTNNRSKVNKKSSESTTSNQLPEKMFKINIPTGNMLDCEGLSNIKDSIPFCNFFDRKGKGDVGDDDSILTENNFDRKEVNEEVSIDVDNEAEDMNREDIKRAKNGNKKLKPFMPSKAIKFSTKSKSKMKRIMKVLNKKKKMQKGDMDNIPLLPNDEKDKHLIFTNNKSKVNKKSSESTTSNQFPEKMFKINIPTGNMLDFEGLSNMKKSIPVCNFFDRKGKGDVGDDDLILTENNFDRKELVNEEVSKDVDNEAEDMNSEVISRTKKGNKKLKLLMPSESKKPSTKSKSTNLQIMKDLRNTQEADMESIPLEPNNEEDAYLIFTNNMSNEENETNGSPTLNQFPEEMVKINIPTRKILYSQGLDNMEESIPVSNLLDKNGNDYINDDDSILMGIYFDKKEINEEVSIAEDYEAEYIKEDIERTKKGNSKWNPLMPSESTKSINQIMKDLRKAEEEFMKNIPFFPNDEEDTHLIFTNIMSKANNILNESTTSNQFLEEWIKINSHTEQIFDIEGLANMKESIPVGNLFKRKVNGDINDDDSIVMEKYFKRNKLFNEVSIDEDYEAEYLCEDIERTNKGNSKLKPLMPFKATESPTKSESMNLHIMKDLRNEQEADFENIPLESNNDEEPLFIITNVRSIANNESNDSTTLNQLPEENFNIEIPTGKILESKRLTNKNESIPMVKLYYKNILSIGIELNYEERTFDNKILTHQEDSIPVCNIFNRNELFNEDFIIMEKHFAGERLDNDDISTDDDYDAEYFSDEAVESTKKEKSKLKSMIPSKAIKSTTKSRNLQIVENLRNEQESFEELMENIFLEPYDEEDIHFILTNTSSKDNNELDESTTSIQIPEDNFDINIPTGKELDYNRLPNENESTLMKKFLKENILDNKRLNFNRKILHHQEDSIPIGNVFERNELINEEDSNFMEPIFDREGLVNDDVPTILDYYAEYLNNEDNEIMKKEKSKFNSLTHSKATKSSSKSKSTQNFNNNFKSLNTPLDEDWKRFDVLNKRRCGNTSYRSLQQETEMGEYLIFFQLPNRRE